MRLDQISEEEADILRAIIALAQQLPGPLTNYTRALGQIREKEFGSGRRQGDLGALIENLEDDVQSVIAEARDDIDAYLAEIEQDQERRRPARRVIPRR